jgi:hypothetical protein
MKSSRGFAVLAFRSDDDFLLFHDPYAAPGTYDEVPKGIFIIGVPAFR